MSDGVIQIYLYVLLFLSVFFVGLKIILLFIPSARSRRPYFIPITFLQSLLFASSLAIGWYLFTTHRVSNWMVVVITSGLDIVIVYVIMGIGSYLWGRGTDGRAA
jgi:hypothetical protein